MLATPCHRLRRSRWWLVAGLTLLLVNGVSAQVPGLPPGVKPTPEQAQQILQSRPDLVQQLRQRIQGSGLTPEQIRARLRAEGYPENFLDQYLAGADTTRAFSPAPGTLDAIRSLGLLSVESVDSLERLDSTRVANDSVRRVIDSIALARVDSLRQDSLADTLAARRGTLKLFGYEVFRRTTTRFQPVQTGPVDASYRLGPGDVLVLILTGDVELAQSLEVTREGFVFVPQVGQIYVANLTLGQLEDQLYTRLGRVYSGVRRGPNPRTRFSVTVSKLRNIQVFVTGDVLRAGAYQISATGTVLTALYAAGGPTASGSFRRVDVRRGAKLIDSVDVYDYLLHGVTPSSARLESGDVIFVPPRGGIVKVNGRVLRPAIYEIKPQETLQDVIAAAGGFDANAIQSRIQIFRTLPPQARRDGRDRVVIDVSQEQPTDAAPAFPVAAGDSIVVFEVARRLRNYVTVRGNVVVEGPVGFTPGMKLSDAIRLAGGPRPDVYLGQILISRTRADSSRVQLRSAFADSIGRVVSDLTLQEQDEIQVFARGAFRNRPYVTVVGAVRRSGQIPYREGMTLRDAVLMANGLAEDADLREAEIARRVEGATTDSLAHTVRVPLDSSYLFARNDPDSAADPATPLQPYDNVLILRRPGWDLQRLVTLTGQVQHPGRYALTSKTERLADLIARAGGLTTEAYPNGIAFYRRVQPGPAGADRRDSVVDSASGLRPLPSGFRERVGVDLARVLKNPADHDNLILSAGDSIHVPEYDPVVAVTGYVNAPGPVAFTPGKNLDWYVNAAGGYARNGDKKRPYVVQPDGKKETVQRRFLLSDTQPRPGPGAVIYVPEQRGQDQPSNLPAVLGVVASVLASVTTVAVVLTR